MQSTSLRSSRSLYCREVGRLVLPVISLARVCRPSYRSAAPTHSTPGIVIAMPRSPEPCIPIPTIPNRTRSLGPTARGNAFASRMIFFEPPIPPAAAAVPFKNARREKLRFIPIPPVEITATCSCRLLFQRFNRHFFKEHDVVVAVILHSEPSQIHSDNDIVFFKEVAIKPL